jgi:hypothetical protein
VLGPSDAQTQIGLYGRGGIGLAVYLSHSICVCVRACMGGRGDGQGLAAPSVTWSQLYLFQYPNSSFTPAGISAVVSVPDYASPGQLRAVAAAVRTRAHPE